MPLGSAGALYAHAIAIEREAAASYAAFSERMSDLGNPAVAALFRMLGRLEARHLEELERRSAGLELPGVASGYAWLTDGPPETVARELVYRFMTQREALLIARAAEERARSFFRHAARIARDPQVRALADEMAAEEEGHIALIDDMLQRTPASGVDWAALYESGA